MITIISGTNRKDSMTIRVAKLYYEWIRAAGAPAQFLSLEGLNVLEPDRKFRKTEQEILIPSEKFVFVMPEYNGSFPGVLKLLLDNTDIKQCWWHKKAALVGVADGRGGNLRGIEHMTNILHYLKMNVHYNKLPLSRITEEITKDGLLLKKQTEIAIRTQIEEFLKY